MRKEILGFALGATVAVGSLGAGLALRNDGVEFPDGSVQKTAALLPAASAVQGKADVFIAQFQFCSPDAILYTVPAGKRLAIEWISARSFASGIADPVEVYITTLSGAISIFHPLVRMKDSELIDGSFFYSQFWNSPVRLYSDAGTVKFSACRNLDAIVDHGITVTFSGHLVDVP